MQPRRNRLRIAHAADVREGDEEGLLNRIVGIAASAQSPDRAPAERGEMALEEGAQRRRIPLPECGEQIGVGWEASGGAGELHAYMMHRGGEKFDAGWSSPPLTRAASAAHLLPVRPHGGTR